MTTKTTRRALMSAFPAAVAVPSIAMSHEYRQGSSADPHPEWMDRWRAARKQWIALAELPHNGNFDDPRSIECEKTQSEMELRLSTVPATSIAGAIACLSWLEEEISPSEWPYRGHREALLNALAALRVIEETKKLI